MRLDDFGTKLTGAAMAVALVASLPAAAGTSELEPRRTLLAAATRETQETRLDAQHLVDRARLTVSSFATDKRTEQLKKYLNASAGVLIIPKLVRGGIGIGGEAGSGVIMSRDEKTGAWSEPAFVEFGGVSLGPQIGVETAEVMAVIMTEETLHQVIAGELGIGVDAKAVAGSRAARSEAVGTTDRDDIHVFTRGEGAFIGAALKGGYVSSKEDWNQAYYARPVSPSYILTPREKVMNHGSIGLTSGMRMLTTHNQNARQR